MRAGTLMFLSKYLITRDHNKVHCDLYRSNHHEKTVALKRRLAIIKKGAHAEYLFLEHKNEMLELIRG